IANGWIQRAQSILAEIAEPSPEGALLLALRGHMALRAANDPVTAHRLCREAIALSRQCGAVDSEMVALSTEGLALVTEGDVAGGVSRLEGATAAAGAGGGGGR